MYVCNVCLKIRCQMSINEPPDIYGKVVAMVTKALYICHCYGYEAKIQRDITL